MPTCPSGHDSAADDYCDVCGLPMTGSGGASSVEEEAQAPDVEEVAPQPSPGAAPETTDCPNCQAANPPNALFCEACGYDFTTGSMPRPVTPPTVDSVLDLGSPAPGTDDPPTAEAPAVTHAPPVVEPAAPVVEPVETPGSVAPPLAEVWVAEVWIDPDWYADQESSDPLPSAGVPSVIALRSRSILVGRASRSRGIHPDIDLGGDNGISRRHCQLTTDGRRWWVEDLGSSNGTYVGNVVGTLPDDPIPVGEMREFDDDDRIYLGAWTRLVVRKAQPGEV